MQKLLTIKDAAFLMGVTEQFVRLGLQQGSLPFGAAVKFDKDWSYVIFLNKFEEFTGLKVPDSMRGDEL